MYHSYFIINYFQLCNVAPLCVAYELLTLLSLSLPSHTSNYFTSVS
jgi:hypothetical protein